MPTKIIDLDELIAPPRRVKLQGVTYTLPGELPVPLYLRLKATEDAPEDAEAAGGDRVEDLNELLLELFRVHQPDLDELPVGLTQAFTIIPRVYGASNFVDEGDDSEPDGPKQGTAARTGKPSTRRRATPRSRS